MTGAEALALAREYRPTAVSLDVFLPDMLGWTVLNHLKQDPSTRHIPVQMLTLDDDWHHGMSRGAFAFRAPSRPPRKAWKLALIAIKDYASPRRKRLAGGRRQSRRAAQHQGIAGLSRHRHQDRRIGAEALDAVEHEPYDCLVLDLRLPDMIGFRSAGTSARYASAERSAGRRLHRQRAVARGRCPAAHVGA